MALSSEAFSRAQAYLTSHARPLEVARFQHAFAGGSVDAIWSALAAFQNEDGGFGCALEPDVRIGASSALATSLAFQLFLEYDAPVSMPMVKQALGYLMDTLDRNEWHWRIIPENTSDAPHAPWWTQAGKEEAFSAFSLNPTAELLGACLHYRDDVDQSVLVSLTSQVIAHLATVDTLELHDLICCLRLSRVDALPIDLDNAVNAALSHTIKTTVATDPEAWNGYCLRPLQVVDSPDSPWFSGLAKAVDANLAFVQTEQQESGAWEPTWSWGGLHPEVWTQAKREWAGYLTLEMLLLFDRFGLISQ
jgi:hypothetical protein